MPNFVARQWLKAGESQLIAALYGPGRVETELDGVPVSVTTRTAYPAEQTIEFDIQPAQAARFTFTVRIPGWCHGARLLLNGQPLDRLSLEAGTFVPGEREWQPGDCLHLDLPSSWPCSASQRRDLH